MSTGIEEKIKGAPGTKGKTVPAEMNHIVALLSNAMGTNTGVQGLTRAITQKNNSIFYADREFGTQFALYYLDAYINSGTLTLVESLESVFMIDIYFNNNLVAESGVKTFRYLLPNGNSVLLTTTTAYKLKINETYTFLIDIPKGTFTIMDEAIEKIFKTSSLEMNGFKLKEIGKITERMLTLSKDGFGLAFLKKDITYRGDYEGKTTTYLKGVYLMDGTIDIYTDMMKPDEHFTIPNLHKVLYDDKDFIKTDSSIDNGSFKRITITPTEVDNNGLMLDVTYGFELTLDKQRVLYTANFVYVREEGDAVWNYTGDLQDELYLKNTDFLATFACIGTGTITFSGECTLKNKYGIKTYKSGDPIQAGTYEMFGLNLDNVVFDGDVFTDVYIRKNDKQTNAFRMFSNEHHLVNFNAEPNAFRNCTTLRYCWNGCDNMLAMPMINTSKVEVIHDAWKNCKKITSFPSLDFSNVKEALAAWMYCESLTSFPMINFPKVEVLNYCWYGCNSLTSFPAIDTSNITNMYGAWGICTSLTPFPVIDTSKVTQLRAWFKCTSLTSFPMIDTSKVTDMQDSWAFCSSLTSFPAIDISKVTNLRGVWYDCTSLVTIQGLTNNNVAPTNIYLTFDNTPALTRPTAAEQTSILNGNSYHV